jgi:hypothetical protein
MAKTRWKIVSDSIPEVQVDPTWSGLVSHDRVNDGVYFRAKLDGEMVFHKADYQTVKDAPDCEEIEVFLEEYCDSAWVERFRGTFTTYDCAFDEDRCTASVTPKLKDDYICFLKEYTLDKTVANAGPVVTADPFAGTYQGGQECCMDHVAPTPGGPTGPVCAVPSGYCFDKNYFQDAVDGLGNELWQSCFHRVVGVGTPTTPPPYASGWTYISGNDWWRCPGNDDLEFVPLDNGRWLNDILEHLASETLCSLTVRSHFFNLNATHDAPPDNTPYTFAEDNCHKLQVHQKSDVKRPDSTNPAQSFVWKMSFKKLLDDLENMFNVYWKIDGSDLILEHITYFEAAEWLDLSQKSIVKLYEKSENGAPNREEYKYVDKEATFTADFAAYPITYGACGEGTREVTLNYFSNDVVYIRTTDNQAEISDSGFCMVATQEVGAENAIILNNTPMGWSALHENLHKQRRFFPSGMMNDNPESFTFLRKTRKLEPITVAHCCGDAFDPAGYITTTIGEATVERVTKNYFQDTVKIEANL